MKILQINAVCDSGSTGRTCKEMGNILHSLGHESAVAFAVGQAEDQRLEYKIGNRFDQRCHALLSRITGLQGYFSAGATRKLLAFIKEYGPDVVVLRNLHANYIHVPMLLKYLAKEDIPTVAVLHDCWLYTGKCCHYTAAGCYRWQEACGDCPAKKKYNKSWFFDRSAKMLQDKKRLLHAIPRLGVVAVSQWVYHQAQKAPALENAMVMKQIYNWIDTEKFAPGDGSAIRRELGIRDKKVVLSITNAWSESKGLHTVLKVAEQLQADERYVVVGDMPANTQLPSNVIILPRTDDISRLVELYSMADVFLQTSPEETFGKVAAEAMACGTPVVCFDSTANPELVIESCGAAVPAGDTEAMLREMRNILGKGKDTYAAACRASVQTRFRIETLVGQYVDVFRDLQKKQSAPAEKVKLVQINAICDSGSTGLVCKELNEALLRRGDQGLILYGSGKSSYPYGRKLAGKPGIRLHGLLSRLLGKNAAYSPLATHKAIRRIKAFGPNIVHLHNLHGNYINLKPLLKFLAKKDIATVITLHDCWIFTGKCTHYTQTGCYKWQTGCYDCPRLKQDIPSFFFDRTALMWKEKHQWLRRIPRLAVVGVSDWITEEGRKSPFFENAKEITRIYNWIDLDAFYPRQANANLQYGAGEDKHIVLCVGAGWHYQADRTMDLLKLAGALGEDYRILVAGNIAQEVELPENITCVGYIQSAEELAQLYSAADVYVHLSREDTFGKVIAEAMACGTPAVVYDATACSELVGEDCGYAVKTGDVDAITRAIEQIVQKGKACYRDRCIQNVHQRFSKEMLIQQTLSVYDALIQK